MEVFKQNLVVLVLALCLASPAISQTSLEKIAEQGTAEGIIERVESDVSGLFSIWCKVEGRMHEFIVRGARFENGLASSLAAGKRIRVEFKNREHSEMDDFYTANATTIVLLK